MPDFLSDADLVGLWLPTVKHLSTERAGAIIGASGDTVGRWRAEGVKERINSAARGGILRALGSPAAPATAGILPDYWRGVLHAVGAMNTTTAQLSQEILAATSPAVTTGARQAGDANVSPATAEEIADANRSLRADEAKRASKKAKRKPPPG